MEIKVYFLHSSKRSNRKYKDANIKYTGNYALIRTKKSTYVIPLSKISRIKIEDD